MRRGRPRRRRGGRARAGAGGPAAQWRAERRRACARTTQRPATAPPVGVQKLRNCALRELRARALAVGAQVARRLEASASPDCPGPRRDIVRAGVV
eukprot:15435101-Alexandrium_andersonii.AAC.1